MQKHPSCLNILKDQRGIQVHSSHDAGLRLPGARNILRLHRRSVGKVLRIAFTVMVDIISTFTVFSNVVVCSFSRLTVATLSRKQTRVHLTNAVQCDSSSLGGSKDFLI